MKTPIHKLYQFIFAKRKSELRQTKFNSTVFTSYENSAFKLAVCMLLKLVVCLLLKCVNPK